MPEAFTKVSLAAVHDAAPGNGFGDRWEARVARDALAAERTGVTLFRLLPGKRSPFKLPTSLSQLRNLLGKHDESQSITLTVLDKLQKVAEAQLAGRDGSVVALDPRTGSILGMYSNPSFDPNLLSGHNQAQVQASYKALSAQPGGVLAPGAYRQRFFPGSTFKMVTSGAVYDHKPNLATKVVLGFKGVKLTPQTPTLSKPSTIPSNMPMAVVAPAAPASHPIGS